MIFEVNRKYIVGEIDLDIDNINEVNIEVGKNFPSLGKAGKCIIQVMGSEGSHVPHFHVDGKDKSICIYLFDNRYFEHGVHKGTLAARDCPVLDRWLRQENSRNKGMTNWEVAVNIWDNVNGKGYLTLDNPPENIDNQPDYQTIKPYKGDKKK